MSSKRRLPVDTRARLDHQYIQYSQQELTNMDIYKEAEEKTAAITPETEVERERHADPFRPLVLALLHQARDQAARRKAKERAREGKTELEPAQRNGNAKP